ncbi:radical SAM protein [candidate division KSB1 bacterium]|nr:radical SAM protein [candidate division KSB1 bacterium]
MDGKLKFEEDKLKGKVIVVSQKEEIFAENYIWNCKNKVVYGPILSRRLGKSLGINLFPSDFNICTFDCIYCDCGPTKRNTVNTYNFASMEKIKDELEHSFEHHSQNRTPIDYITFAGNGEPTYYPFFPEIVNFVLELRDKYFPQKPLAIFSNGTMISKQEVIESIEKLDERIFKLDAGDERTFKLISRPNNNVSFEEIVDRLANLKGIKISSAVLCSGIRNLGSLKNCGYIEALKKIEPHEVHLYSIDYPPAYRGIRRARVSKMLELGQYITSNMDIAVKVLRARKAWR